MRIDRNVTNKNQNNYSRQKTFGAKLGDVTPLVEGLQKSLFYKQTDAFLSELENLSPQIKGIKFNNTEDVAVTAQFLPGVPPMVFDKIKIVSKRVGKSGEGDVTISTGDITGLLSVGGKSLARRFLRGIKKATGYIVEDVEYLKEKARTLNEKVNN